jgi:hypothetical protein
VDVDTGTSLFRVAPADGMYIYAVLRVGNVLVTAGYSGKIEFWSATDFKMIHRVQSNRISQQLCLSEDGSLLGVCGGAGGNTAGWHVFDVK